MDRPTASDVRAQVPPQFNWTAAGYPTPVPPAADTLDVRVATAAATLALTIGRKLEAIVDEDEVVIARNAVALLVLYDAMGGSAASLQVASRPWLRSFTAGSYSETRFSPAEMAGNGKDLDVIAKLHPWPALARALWLLATPAKRVEWQEVFLGLVAPAGGIFEVFAGERGAGVWPYGPTYPCDPMMPDGPFWPS